MRDTPLTNCEKDFVKKSIAENRRVDGRQPYDTRKAKITFGVDRGSCQVELGQTRVFAQVSCEIAEPKPTRPSDGILFVNLELSPMACPSFEAGRLSDFGVELNRLLERCLKESRCVDTESLCIATGEKVWSIRVDVHVLNHDGNIIDAASIAAISVLAHFRRPDVTVSGTEITIHPIEEREPVPLSVHHMPLCVTFAFFEQGKYLVVDPTDLEEKVMDGKMVIGMNKHREICTLQITGDIQLEKDQVLRCSNIAVVKVTEMTELIHKALDNDRQARASGRKWGFAESISTEKVTSNQMKGSEIEMEEAEEQASALVLSDQESDTPSDIIEDNEPIVHVLNKGVGSIGLGGASQWNMDEEEANEMETEAKSKLTGTKSTHKKSSAATAGDLGDESEEEETIVLGQDMKIISQQEQQESQKIQTKTGGVKKKKGRKHTKE
ncbi:hypothetical protein ACJMK2_032676 [Sinanodonta woodiana]|uniref:Exosome complex component RRP45 n=1 Tax=Sinanodonta woodiana TaxID=1069815 RepID=A0ABD3X2H8_SINWO